MHDTAKKTIAVLASLVVVSLVYYGSYLPLRKGQIFIEGTRNLENAKSLQEFEGAVSPALDAPGPIGQPELVRNVAGMVLNALRSSGDKPGIASALLDFIDGYYQPILAHDRGMSFEQDLFLMGTIYETAAVKTRQVSYLTTAEKYLRHGYELGPRRPQFLYGLLDIYRIENDVARATAIAEQIVAQWPTDTTTKGVGDQLRARAASSTPAR